MGSTEGYSEEKPVHEVRVSDFYMDETEVTTAAFEKYLRDNDISSDWYYRYVNDEDHWKRFCNIDSGRGHHPVNCVSWYAADDFCGRQGKRLPTEAEWEYAAGNGSAHWKWSLDQNNYSTSKYCAGMDQTCPVKRYPANQFGLYDMSGNVWEWCLDWYDLDYYQSSPSVDPQGPPSGDYRVLRGGSWYDSIASFLRVSSRYNGPPDVRFNFYGFRCVLSSH